MLVTLKEILKIAEARKCAIGSFNTPDMSSILAVLGAAELNAAANNGIGRGIIGSTVFGLCTGIGFGLALILFASLRERLELSMIPKPFQGVAIALITAGILAMAFMGFSGLVH